MSNDNFNQMMQRLVRLLIDRTENGEQKWEDTADEDAFRSMLRTGFVRVNQNTRHSEDQYEPQVGYSITLLDKKGREVDVYAPGPQERTDDVVELWRLARRSARQGDELVKSFLKEFD
ncbi:MAG: hypothetical protein K2X38_16940 [Gemmataceae bacterium]|nr:hypothetical protein [Gemmataceae bacterium]